jgi:hypothetical protein
MTAAELVAEVARGSRLVYYEYCVSFLAVTLRRPSGIYLLRAGELGLLRGLSFTVLSLMLGWWGVPWGLIYTPLVVLTNLCGGRDVTEELLARLEDEDGGLPRG